MTHAADALRSSSNIRIVVALPRCGDFDSLVTATVTAVIEKVASLLGRGPAVVTVLMTSQPAEDLKLAPLREAAFEALRAVVGALTLELRRERLRINLVRARPEDDASETIAWLESQLGAFTAGATIDLTGAFE